MLSPILGRIVFSLAIWFEGSVFSPQNDYKLIFGADWEKAETFVTENQEWMKALCVKYDVSYPFAVSVVFPELIRYSALRDKIEITLLKALYINLGKEYSDFSIGQFQMKPSFAESLLGKIPGLKGKIRNQFRNITALTDSVKYRSAIVKNLETRESQFLYLIAFIRLCETIYPVGQMEEEDKLRFVSTVYNHGLNRSFDEIRNLAGKKFFHTKIVPSETYSYSDISAYQYKSFQNIRTGNRQTN